MSQIEALSISAGSAGGAGATGAAGEKGPSLIVWPEVPAPFSMQRANFVERAERIARESRSDFLVGVIDWKPAPNAAGKSGPGAPGGGGGGTLQQRGVARPRRPREISV